MFNFKRIILYFTILLCIICGTNNSYAIEESDEHTQLFKAPKVINGSILSIKDCVALAYKNSPKVRRKKYELDIAKSSVGVAKSRFFPVIGAGVGFNYERNSDSIYYDKRYRDLPYVGVTINQLVYDFGKSNANIKMEQFFKIGAEYEFVDELCHTLFDIKGKYYNLLREKAFVELAQKDVDINKEFVKTASGTPDLLTAELNLSEAEIKLSDANKKFINAKYNLSNTMYLDNNINYQINDTQTFSYNINKNIENNQFTPIVFPFKTEEATSIAYQNSPDLQVLINTKKAMEQSLKYVKRSAMPELNAGVGYGFTKTYDTQNNSLTVGVGLETELNIKELKHNIDIAKSEVNLADNEINLFKKDLYYEVQRALNNVQRTEEEISVAEREIIQAQKNFQVVKNEYKNKKLDYVALQNARKDYINSQKRYITSLYDYNMAIIQTEMAMHYHLVDIHHKSEHAIHNHADELLEHLNEALNCDEKENSKKKKHKKHL